MKAVKRVLVAVAAFTVALNAWATWKSTVAEGYFDDPANWGEGYVPTNTYNAAGSVWNAQWWCSSDWDSTVLLRDWTGTFNMFSLNLYSNNTLVFDGAGADFRMTALPDHYKDRNGSMPLCFYNGSGTQYQAMQLDVGSKRGEGFRWTNVLMRVVHTMGEDPADLTDNVLSVAFERGWASFAGLEGANATYSFSIDGGGVSGCDLSLWVTNGAEVVMPILNLNGAGSRKVTCTVKGEGSRMTVNGYLRSGYANTYKTGTNFMVVADGGRLDVLDKNGQSILVGYRGESSRADVLVVTGSDSMLNFGASSSTELNGNVMTEFSDGSTTIMSRTMTQNGYFAGARNVATMSGKDTFLILTNTVTGIATLSVGNVGEATFVMDEGTIKSCYPTNFLTVYLGQGDSGNGTFRMNGGKLLCGDGATVGTAGRGNICVGLKGSALFEVNGGEVQVHEVITLGSDGGIAGPVTNHYRQTGGYVYAKKWLAASNTSQDDRYSRIDLDGGVFHSTRIMGGGALTDPTFGVELYANGGTLRARTSNILDGLPFLAGCKVAAVGERGLTLDIQEWDQHVYQKFTDQPGQTGRVIVTGTKGTAYFFANGGTQSELVCAAANTAIAAGVTNWMTTAVITNNAVFSVAAITEPLAMKGLSLGNAKSFGVLKIGPVNRLNLKTIELANADICLESGFSATESYPLITVEGELDVTTRTTWRNVIVSGSVPSGYIARPTSAYEDGKTVLSLSFEEAVEPSVENVWNGVSGETDMCWDDADAWGVGVPDLSSVATFSSEESSVLARVNVATLLSPVGKMSFTAARDYVLTGAGSLAFGDTGYDVTISVSAGNQAIEVPVETVRNLRLEVANGASLTFGDALRVKSGSLYVNPTYSNGRVRLAGDGALFRTGIEHNGGILEIASPETLSGIPPKTLFHFQAYGTLRIMGEPTDDEFVLPFDMYFQSRNWGTAEIVRTDRPTVIRPYRDAMTSGANVVKRGAAKLVFEVDAATKLRLTDTNGKFGGNDYTSVPMSALNFSEEAGSIPYVNSYCSFNVMGGEVLIRGTAASVAPSVNGQQVQVNRPSLIGLWSTNAVVATPGLVLDHVWGEFGAAHTSFVAIAQNAYAGEYADLATNAYLTIRNGSTLDGGEIRLGGVADGSKTALDVSPRVTVDDAVCSAAHAILLSARAGCHSVWTVTGDSAVYAGTEGAIWNGDVAGSFGGTSVFAKNATGECATFTAGAEASGELVFGTGSTCCATGSTAADGAAASVAFDGGSLVVPDGTTIDFAAGCGLKAKAGGLRMDVPEGEMWTLASDVSGEGAVLLHGAGTLAIDGTITAAFGGTGTISGGTLAKSRIRLDYADGAIAETPNFDGTVFTGRTKVDFGRAEGDIIDASLLVGKTVARYTGTAPDVSFWKLTGTGYSHPYAKFVAAEGEVKISEAANETGLTIIVR